MSYQRHSPRQSLIQSVMLVFCGVGPLQTYSAYGWKSDVMNHLFTAIYNSSFRVLKASWQQIHLIWNVILYIRTTFKMY
jgi:hypothetical protein